MLKKALSALISLSIIISMLAACRQESSVSDTKKYDDNYRNFYEIYVRSFSDSNGDHIGDLNGLLSKIDYLKAASGTDDSKSLGIDGVWLMPIFTSPSEHKYDVTDYYSIDPTYGTMEDFENLLAKFHERGIHVILDMVLNHTSSEHPWFKQAVSDLNNGIDSKYVHYYNFTKEPELDDEGNVKGFNPVEGNTEGYYYESRFSVFMPDINLDNADVVSELKDAMKFWIEKGIDGYRLDACTSYFTNDAYKSIDFLNQVTEYCKSINPDFYLVGEVWDSAYVISEYYGSQIDSLFNFDCSFNGAYQGLFNNISTGNGSLLSKRVEEWNNAIRNKNINAIDAPFISNHDLPRSGTYFKNSSDRKLAASLYMMLPGNSFIYYGEEIGMTEGWNNDSEKRLPIKWSLEENGSDILSPAGAGYVKSPFLGIYDQLESPDSLVCHYQSLIKLKNRNPEIQRAKVVSACDIDNINVAAYTCAYENSSVMVLQNITDSVKKVDLKSTGYDSYNIMSGFVIASDYVEEEEHNAYMNDKKYDAPEVIADASPIAYVNGILTMPPKATVVLRNSKQVNSTFVTTTTTTMPYVTPTDTEEKPDSTIQ